ncbi:MAG: hypothetical protein IPM97_05860 [Bdellovibrionaceae bacterium]|nr:hypothetical protein [Pseudobdellovibrionaceae bacterium]
MRVFTLIAILFSSLSVFAAEECFQLTTAKDSWSKTPELLCIEEDAENNEYLLTLKSGMPFNQKTVATFNLNLLQRARCVDCNADVFGVENPSNSIFNQLAIKFKGKRDLKNRHEEGTVSIGSTQFFYQRSF